MESVKTRGVGWKDARNVAKLTENRSMLARYKTNNEIQNKRFSESVKTVNETKIAYDREAKIARNESAIIYISSLLKFRLSSVFACLRINFGRGVRVRRSIRFKRHVHVL